MSCDHKISILAGLCLSKNHAKCKRCGEIVRWDQPSTVKVGEKILSFFLLFAIIWYGPEIGLLGKLVMFCCINLLLEICLVVFFTRPSKEKDDSQV